MPLVLDTYNVLHVVGVLPPELAGLDLPGLIGLIGRSRYRSEPLTLVCDGPPRTDEPVEPDAAANLVFSGRGRSADDVIMDMVAASTSPRRLLVVSSDRAILRAARMRRCPVLTSETFLAHLATDHQQPNGPAPAPREKSSGLLGGEVAGWLGELELSRSERAELDRIAREEPPVEPVDPPDGAEGTPPPVIEPPPPPPPMPNVLPGGLVAEAEALAAQLGAELDAELAAEPAATESDARAETTSDPAEDRTTETTRPPARREDVSDASADPAELLRSLLPPDVLAEAQAMEQEAARDAATEAERARVRAAADAAAAARAEKRAAAADPAAAYRRVLPADVLAEAEALAAEPGAETDSGSREPAAAPDEPAVPPVIDSAMFPADLIAEAEQLLDTPPDEEADPRPE